MTRPSTEQAVLRLCVTTCAILLAACQPTGPHNTEWPQTGGDWRGQHQSAASQIDAANFGELGLAFEFRDFVVRGRTHRAMQATPVMVDRTLYFSGPWGVAYAVDAVSGRHLWTYDPQADGNSARDACCDVSNRGVAVAGDRLFVAASDGQLAAVDRKTGKELWKVDTVTDHRWNQTSTGAPQVANDLVLIGNSGADMGSRGYLSAYDQASGALRWRFWVVPGDPRDGPDENPDVTAARRTWPADTIWTMGMGGNPWDAIAFDPESDTVFVGTGNGGPHPAWQRSASGAVTDQLYLSSIVALNARTGRVKWHYQTTPGDSWDYAAASPLVMAELDIGGARRKVIMQAPKNGFFYVLDRQTGELLNAEPYTPVTWATHIDKASGRPVLTETSDFRDQSHVIWPSMAGGHSWTPMAFSPRTGLVYLPVFEAAASYERIPVEFRPGSPNHGAFNRFGPFANERLQAEYKAGPAQGLVGRLKAWDPVSGKARWQTDDLPLLNGGTLVMGDLVLQGTVAGVLDAYDAASGRKAGSLEIGTAISAAPMTYTIDGTQYVAFLAGFGGPQGGFFAPGSAPARYENFERLVVLRLGGTPVPLPPRFSPPAPEPLPKPIAASSATLAKGQRLFERNCNRCHLMGGPPGMYPSLWNMAPGTLAAFDQIVGDGAYQYAGMGGFSDVLSPDDIAALKAFIVNDTIVKRKQGPAAGAQFREATH